MTYFLWTGTHWQVIGGALDPATWLFTFFDGSTRQFTVANITVGTSQPRKPPVGDLILWIYYS